MPKCGTAGPTGTAWSPQAPSVFSSKKKFAWLRYIDKISKFPTPVVFKIELAI